MPEQDLRLALNIGYSGRKMDLPVEMVLEAERLGYHAVWSAESYGSDSITPLAWLGALTSTIHLGTAIMQMPARTPAMTAMTAMTLDQMSGGRMLLGLGLSGPQVVEGWHGRPYGKPLGKTREYVSIVRKIFEREDKLEHDGRHYQIPYQGADATGLGKPIKSILHGRSDLPIYLAAIGPKNVALTAEIADGWLPIFFAPQHYDAIFKDQVEAGFARAGSAGPGGDKGYGQFDIAATVPVVWAIASKPAATRLSPSSPSTLAAWALARRISTTTLPAALATRTPPTRFRISSWQVTGAQRWHPCPMVWSMKSPCAAQKNVSPNDCRSGEKAL